MKIVKCLTRASAIRLAALFLLLGFAASLLGQTQSPPALASDRENATAAPNSAMQNPAEQKLSFLQLLKHGGWAMLPLGACSLLGVAVIIERGLALRRSQILPPEFLPGLEKVYQGPGYLEAALAYCRIHPSAISRILSAGLRKLPDGIGVAEQALADQGATEIARLRRNLRLLHGIAALTPTIGLLGTVWGMIQAFQAASIAGLGHSEVLTTGIYEALVATMTGLMIAAPVLMCYYIYLSLIDRTILELNDACQNFLEQQESPAQAASQIAAS